MHYGLPTISIDASSCLDDDSETSFPHDHHHPIDDRLLYVSLYLNNTANKHAEEEEHDNLPNGGGGDLDVDQFDTMRTRRLSLLSLSSSYSAYDSFSNIQTPLPNRIRQLSQGGCAKAGENQKVPGAKFGLNNFFSNFENSLRL